MKKLSAYLFIILFSFSAPSFADDVSDFQIEGMSIGDSLLDYFSEEEIKSWKKTFYPGSKKFYMAGDKKNFSSNIYDKLTFHLKSNDKKYTIYSLKGVKNFPNNLKACKKMKNEVNDEISSLLGNVKARNYESKYKIDDGKTIAYVSEFEQMGGEIRIWCVNVSKVSEKKRNWVDNLSVSVSSEEFAIWIDEESR